MGTADDVLAVGTLSYDAAVRAARDKVCGLRKAEEEAALEPLPMVADVIRGYIEMRDARSTQLAGRPQKSDASSNLRKHVLKASAIAPKPLDQVSEEELRAWRKALPLSLKRVTRVRTATNLKAALNAAYRLYRKRLPPDFAESVRLGLSFEDEVPSFEERARENQILDDAEVRTIIAMAVSTDVDGDLARLIIVLAATGARFSQVARMIVGDVQFGQSRLIVPNSRKGKRRHVSYTAIRVGEDVLGALRPACEGRSSREPLLCRWRYVQTGVEIWRRDRRGPWTSSSEMARPWKEICERAGIEPPGGHADAFDVKRFAVRVAVLRGSSGSEELLLSDAGRNVRLDVCSGSLLDGPVRLRYLIDGMAELGHKLMTLRRLVALRRLGRFPLSLFPGERRAERWILIFACSMRLAPAQAIAISQPACSARQGPGGLAHPFRLSAPARPTPRTIGIVSGQRRLPHALEGATAALNRWRF